MIKPNGVANDISRKPEAMIAIIIFHQFRLHQPNSTRQVDSAHKSMQQILRLLQMSLFEKRDLVALLRGDPIREQDPDINQLVML